MKLSETTGYCKRNLKAFNTLAQTYTFTKYAGRRSRQQQFPNFDRAFFAPPRTLTPQEKEDRLRGMMGNDVYGQQKQMGEDTKDLIAESRVLEEQLVSEEKQRVAKEQEMAASLTPMIDQMLEEFERRKNTPPPPPTRIKTDAELAADSSGTPQPTEEELKKMLKPIGKLKIENGKPNLKAKAQIQLAKVTRFMRNNKLPLTVLLAAGLGYGGYRYWKKRKQRKVPEQ